MNIKGLRFVKSLSWDSVFKIWEVNEAGDPSWQAHAKSRDFFDWRAWRQVYTDQLGLEKLSWSYYSVLNPVQTIPAWRAGPFRAWAKFYNNQHSVPFSELIQHQGVQANKRLQKMIKNFPVKMNLIGVQTAMDQVIIIEGTHRCLAYVFLLDKSLAPTKCSLNIALAPTKLNHLPLVTKGR
jgi:DNA-binding transcriptional MocR family regulator